MKILVTCPPMVAALAEFAEEFRRRGMEAHAPPVAQTLPPEELKRLLPGFDGWIIGDDPTGRDILAAGKRGRLRAAVKWGAGTDNVDFKAFAELGIPVRNTPRMFGEVVADVALGYLIGLARELFLVDREVRSGRWPKPAGVSLAGRTVALAGFGDVGRALARRLIACGMKVIAYDPAYRPEPGLEAVEPEPWPDRLKEADFLVLACALNEGNRRMVGARTLALARPGLRIVNVARGGLVDESALAAALESGQVHSAALDVFEAEPLPADSPLRRLPRVVLGSHNASNTVEAVRLASRRAIETLAELLGMEAR